VGTVTAFLAVVAVAAAWWQAALAGSALFSIPMLLVALLLDGAVLLAYRFPLALGAHMKVQMATVPYYLLAVLLPPPAACVATGGGALLGELSVRRARSTWPSDIATATGRRTLIALVGSVVVHQHTTVVALPFVAAAVSMLALDLLTFPLVVAPMSGQRPLHVLLAAGRASMLIEGTQYLIGLFGALVLATELWGVFLLSLPVALLYQAFRSLAEAESARRAAEEARRALDEALKGRDAIFTAASHDLRTPLTVIGGRIALLRVALEREAPPTADELRGHITTLERVVRRMTATVAEITDVLQMQMGTPLMLTRTLLDVGALVRGTIQSMARHDVDRVLVKAPPGLFVEGDQSRLERVVQNLLENGLKYSPPECPVVVDIALRDEWVVVSVRDRGIGILAEDLPHIFEQFFRGSSVQSIPGTGIGLAGAKRIIDQHGGRIEVASTPGQGTTVMLFLPQAPAGPPEVGAEGAPHRR
jgi:signal transduction histidine kinase